MLTRKQRELLLFIHREIQDRGISPSYDEMKDALDLASKSGVHRMMLSLEERGFIRRLERRARAIEVLKLPSAAIPPAEVAPHPFVPPQTEKKERSIPILGRIAAGVPIEAIQNEIDRITPPFDHASDAHFALEVLGDSMIDAGILNGDIVIIERTAEAQSGDIVVALIDRKEATLKRLRKRGASIALESANPAYETSIFGTNRVQVQGRLVALMRQYSRH